MKRFASTLIICLAAVLMFSGMALAAAPYIINASGGDCSQIGTWNSTTATCTLNQDVIEPSDLGCTWEYLVGYPQNYSCLIHIVDPGITLDGAGHTVAPTQPPAGASYTRAVIMTSANDTTITNTVVSMDHTSALSGATMGIFAAGSGPVYITPGVPLTGTVIDGNRIEMGSQYDSASGVQLFVAEYSTVRANIINSPIRGDGSRAAIHLKVSENNVIEGNDAHFAWRGVWLQNSDNNFFFGNTFTDHYGGFTIWAGDGSYNIVHDNDFTGNVYNVHFSPLSQESTIDNQFYNNNFRNYTNPAFMSIIMNTPVAFSVPTNGGNYWDTFDEPAEGCSDSDGDGICDSAYVFTTDYTVETDEYPFTSPLSHNWAFNALGDTGGGNATYGPGDNIAIRGSEIGVLWAKQVGGLLDIFFVNSTDNGETWGTETPIAGQMAFSDGVAIAAGSYGGETVFHFAYAGPDDGVFYNNSNGEEIVITNGYPISTTDESRSIVADDQGNVYILFQGYDFSVNENQIYVACLSTDQNGVALDSVEVVDTCVSCWKEPDIALDATGTPYVIWYDSDGVWKLKMNKRQNKNHWDTPSIIRESNDYDWFATLAISNTDKICASWWDGITNIMTTCSVDDGKNWTEQAVESGFSNISWRPSIAFGSDGYLRMTWGNPNGLFFKEEGASGWGDMETVAVPNSTIDPSMALDENDKAHIVFTDNNSDTLLYTKQLQ